MDAHKISWGFWITIALVTIGIFFCIWVISAGDLSNREGLLLSIILTILSAVVSWIIAKFFADYSSNKNLRIFALKAAEKVTNLSNELDRLSVFLQQELENEEYESPSQTLLARDSRIEGAIHIINTLRSVNDKSLSDWQGVIGEEIVARQVQQEEREEEIREIVEKIEALYEKEIPSTSLEQEEQNRSLQHELEGIKEEVRLIGSQVSGFPIMKRKSSSTLEHVEIHCPECSALIRYRQKTKNHSFKGIICDECGSQLISSYENGNFILKLRTKIPEKIDCPKCSHSRIVDLDPMPGSSLVILCEECNSRIRIFRTSTGLGVRLADDDLTMPTVQITEEFLNQVQEILPPQPWPKGAAKAAANKLNVSTHSVSMAIDELIRKGVYKPQIDGILYVKET